MQNLKKQIWIIILLINIFFTNTIELSALSVSSSFQNPEFISQIMDISREEPKDFFIKSIARKTIARKTIFNIGRFVRYLKNNDHIELRKIIIFSLLAISPLAAYKNGMIDCKRGLVIGTAGTLVTKNPTIISLAGMNCLLHSIIFFEQSLKERNDRKYASLIKFENKLPILQNPIENMINEPEEDLTLGIQIIDLSNSTAPLFLNNYDTPGSKYDILIIADSLFIEDNDKEKKTFLFPTHNTFIDNKLKEEDLNNVEMLFSEKYTQYLFYTTRMMIKKYRLFLIDSDSMDTIFKNNGIDTIYIDKNYWEFILENIDNGGKVLFESRLKNEIYEIEKTSFATINDHQRAINQTEAFIYSLDGLSGEAIKSIANLDEKWLSYIKDTSADYNQAHMEAFERLLALEKKLAKKFEAGKFTEINIEEFPSIQIGSDISEDILSTFKTMRAA